MGEFAYVPGQIEDRVLITKDDIVACGSVPTLLAWLSDLEGTRGDITATIDARKLTETDDEEWAIRAGDALSYSSMGAKRIKRKLRELGVNPDPLPVDDQAALEKARSTARFAGFLLKVMDARLPQSVLQEIKAAATELAVEGGGA
jgi:hypothetical protein